MKNYFTKLSPGVCALLTLPVAMIAYSVVMVVVPLVVQAVVPEVVRTVLHLI
jgi:hypothetical protein